MTCILVYTTIQLPVYHVYEKIEPVFSSLIELCLKIEDDKCYSITYSGYYVRIPVHVPFTVQVLDIKGLLLLYSGLS